MWLVFVLFFQVTVGNIEMMVGRLAYELSILENPGVIVGLCLGFASPFALCILLGWALRKYCWPKILEQPKEFANPCFTDAHA